MITFSGDWWIRTVAIPVKLDRHALQDNDEYVEHVEDGDDAKEGPNRNSLPFLARTDSQKKQSNNELDEHRDEYVDTLADVLPEEGDGVVVYRYICNMFAQTPTNGDERGYRVKHVDCLVKQLVCDPRMVKEIFTHKGNYRQPILCKEPLEDESHGVTPESDSDKGEHHEENDDGRQLWPSIFSSHRSNF